MEAVPVKERMTADEYLARPFEEGLRRQELVDGEVVVSQATALHARLQKSLIVALEVWVRGGQHRGEVFVPIDVKLDDLNVFAPDISWYSALNAIAVQDQPPYPCPDLAIEVRSPSTWHYDIGAKKSTYERHGLAELWLVDPPAAQVLIFRRSGPGAKAFDLALERGRGDALESPLLPDFALALDELFETR